MSQRNEPDIPTENPRPDNGAAAAPSTPSAGAGLKSLTQISESAEQVNLLSTLGLISDRQARVLLGGLDLQLRCTSQASRENAPVGGTDVPPSTGIQALAEWVERDPGRLRLLFPSLKPEAWQDLLQRLRPGRTS